MLDPRIDAIRQKYDLGKDDFWKLPQGRDVWLVKHAALEVVAAKAGIVFEEPQIIEANGLNGVAALYVRGHLDKRSVWSTGEASPKNCKTAYPWAIAEKRAIDRVILKLIGLHGLVYSEEEADDFKEQNNGSTVAQNGDKPKRQVGYRDDGTRTSYALKTEQPDLWDAFGRELEECQTLISLEKFKVAWRKKAAAEKWNPSYLAAAKDRIEGRENAIRDEMDRLAEASPDELADVPLNAALEHSLRMNPLNAG